MELEGVKYYVKPMNCPMHHKIFGSKGRSYRDLPVRLAEYGTCYRYEKSGELFGLMRVRSMQMNDAHIYCSEDQFEQEFMGVVALYRKYFELFGIEKYVMRLSLHSKQGLGKKYVDNERLWLKTEDMVRRAMDNGGVPYVERADEAAFYGPKIDVQVWSAIGREFSLMTNQVDFAVPERFDLKFTNKEGHDEVPLCIHRAPLSTHERMVGFLLEHYAGNFPVWLSPEQVRVISITDAQNEYAENIAKQLRENGIRAQADVSGQRMNAKIRQAQLMKVPYMIVVGDNEMQAEQVSLRVRDGSQQNNISLLSSCHGQKTGLSEEPQSYKITPDRGRRGGKIDRLRSILLTIHPRSWYYSPAKKPALGWDLFLKLQEYLISANEFRVNEGIRVPEVRLIGPNVRISEWYP
jgi:threonyl-tRNA synthetase